MYLVGWLIVCVGVRVMYWDVSDVLCVVCVGVGV